jgi:ribonuclease D
MVIGDDALLSLARVQPQEVEELSHIPDLVPRLAERYAEPILAALTRGRSVAPPRPPAAEPVDPAVLARYDQLRRWRKAVAAARGVESDIVLPREVLWDIARAAPRTLQALEPLLACLPWRLHTYGPTVLASLWGAPTSTE